MRATLIGRHTAACYLLNEKGLSMDVVSRILGHATTKITRHYAKLMDETVLEAVERADMLASSYSTLPGTKKALFVPGGMLKHAGGNDFTGFCSQREPGEIKKRQDVRRCCCTTGLSASRSAIPCIPVCGRAGK